MPSRPIIYLPIETQAREFEGKLMLAAIGAEAGFDVVLGEQNSLLRAMRYFPRGVYVDKSIARTRLARFRSLRQLGHEVVAWCEEGLVYRDRDAYLHERVCVDSLEEVGAFFAWGGVQADAVLRKAPRAAEKLERAGNPRFDVLRPGLRAMFSQPARALRREHGPFILVNTNFARFNHFNGSEYVIQSLRRRGVISTPSEEAFYRDWSAYLGQLFQQFSVMVRALAKAFPRHRIVLRPHPSENHAAWRMHCEGLANVEVIHEGSAIPWILASEAVVHNSCTTGVEAYVLGRPVFAYRPVTHEVLDSELPNAVSIEARDICALVAGMEQVLTGARVEDHQGDERRRDVARRYIANLDGPLAAERIAEALAGLRLNGPGWHNPVRQRLVGAMEARVRPLVSRIRAHLPGYPDYRAYAQQKFPGIGPRDISSAMGQLRSATGRFTDITAQLVSGRPSCYLLSRVE